MEKFIWNGLEKHEFTFSGGSAKLLPENGALRIHLPYSAAFGGGERFHTINLKGYTVDIAVEEKFCEQGEKTYCPAPFFFTDSGFGLYAATGSAMRFIFNEDSIVLTGIPTGTEITLFSGASQTIIAEYMSIFGESVLPPSWVFLPWISANHWDTQEKTEKQIELLKKYDFPAGVIVLEAWSDEATFYIFNGAKYTPKPDGAFTFEDFSFPEDGPWPNPKAMIEKLHEAGLHVVLWQIPVYKKQGPDEIQNQQNDLDRESAEKLGLCVRCTEGLPYTIPEGNWFAGSMIPDFTNPEAKQDWFRKRQYLLDIGVDGFKTDGGEFIYRDDLRFHNGLDGAEMKNSYPQCYAKAYTKFLDKNHVLFSRAGYAGQHTTPMLWAGDQKSTFDELRSQLRAGLSAAMSGIIFWGFDIGGFAGELPNADLYLRATQMACFCPVMQWHSEPDGGQFKEVMATQNANNERSPWNIANRSGSDALLERLRFYHKLREEFAPYIYEQAKICVAENRPLIYPLAYAHMDDAETHDITDEFMLGSDFLIAPIVQENTTTRDIYLPEGTWQDYWSKEEYTGRQTISFSHEWHIPVYRRKEIL
ncbi:MAG: glycosyl hydrolase [Oscillospiraceae bacterium]|nr:glycosyl hydrolase [Oscillospiraceae bacterium]